MAKIGFYIYINDLLSIRNFLIADLVGRYRARPDFTFGNSAGPDLRFNNRAGVDLIAVNRSVRDLSTSYLAVFDVVRFDSIRSQLLVRDTVRLQ